MKENSVIKGFSLELSEPEDYKWHSLQEKGLFDFTTKEALLLNQKPLKPQTLRVGRTKGRFVNKHNFVWLADAAAAVVITLVAAIFVEGSSFLPWVCFVIDSFHWLAPFSVFIHFIVYNKTFEF